MKPSRLVSVVAAFACLASLATAARTESFVQNVPIPTLGGTARAYVSKNASVTAEFTAFKWNRSNINGKVYDFDIYATAHLGRNLGAQVGYRRLTADFTVDDDAGRATAEAGPVPARSLHPVGVRQGGASGADGDAT